MANESFTVTVKNVAVKSKTVKHEDWDEVIRIGTLTLEFDADDARVDVIKKMIGERPVLLGLADTQMSLDDAMRTTGDRVTVGAG
jgi:hypothetical protein